MLLNLKQFLFKTIAKPEKYLNGLYIPDHGPLTRPIGWMQGYADP